MLVFFLIGVAILLGLLSLRGDSGRARYARETLARRLPDAQCPPATVIVPVKGFDEGLAANLASLAALDYPDYELLVAVRARADIPAGVVLPPRARVIVAGEGHPGNGEKINNLLAAVAAARPQSEILAFADSDGRVSRGWLRALAAPLGQPGVGASTGYRWHIPLQSPSFWSLLRSIWNSVVAGGFGPGDNGFVWGGAMALRRETFARARVAAYWHGAVSDDFRLAEAVHDAGLGIVFAPGALVATVDGTTGGEFLSWIGRQMVITKTYRRGLWTLALVAHVVYVGALIVSSTHVPGALIPQLLLAYIKGRNRAAIARRCMPEYDAWFARWGWVYGWGTVLGTLAWVYSFAASARTNRIVWRGREYLLRYPGKPASV